MVTELRPNPPVLTDGESAPELIYAKHMGTGTANNTTLLRGDRTWVTPATMGILTGSGVSGQVAYFNGTSTVTSASTFLWSGTKLTAGTAFSTTASTFRTGSLP